MNTGVSASPLSPIHPHGGTYDLPADNVCAEAATPSASSTDAPGHDYSIRPSAEAESLPSHKPIPNRPGFRPPRAPLNAPVNVTVAAHMRRIRILERRSI